MSYALLVAVLESSHQLLEYPLGILLFEASILSLLQVAVQAASAHIFHHEVNVIVRLEGLKDLDYVRVIHFLQEFDLSPDTSLAVDIGKL